MVESYEKLIERKAAELLEFEGLMYDEQEKGNVNPFWWRFANDISQTLYYQNEKGEGLYGGGLDERASLYLSQLENLLEIIDQSRLKEIEYAKKLHCILKDWHDAIF